MEIAGLIRFDHSRHSATVARLSRFDPAHPIQLYCYKSEMEVGDLLKENTLRSV